MADSKTKLRVLIVDDSALYRQTITTVLRDMDDIQIVGTAKDGQHAIEQIAALSPDVITLDVEMPIMNGIETLREMNRRKLDARAIMVSSLTEAGAKVTMDALIEGAFDFIQKPSGGLVKSRDSLRSALREKLTAFRDSLATRDAKSDPQSARQAIAQPKTEPLGVPTASGADARQASSHCDAVVIGSSTGGPKALNYVLPRLHGDFPVPIVVVQHMPAAYTQMMAQRLDEICELTVHEAREGQPVEKGNIYLAPGGKHLDLQRKGGQVIAALNELPPQNSCRPAVDYTLARATDLYRGNLLAVIMTGMGKDGAAACKNLHSRGGTIFAQDAATSAVYGMPKAVIEAGITDRELPLSRIAPAIIRHVNRHRSTESL